MKTILREKLQTHLAYLPEILDDYESGNQFVESACKWLVDLEKLLQQFKQPLVSLPATQRGIIAAARDGHLSTEHISAARTSRKIVRGTTAYSLQTVETAIRHQITQIEEDLRVLRSQMAQLLSVISAHAPLPLPSTTPVSDHWLREVWRSLPLTPETRAMYAYINLSLHPVDKMYLLAELLSNSWSTIRQS